MIFVEAPHSVEELATISSEIDAPLVANMIEEGVTPNLTSAELLRLGYSILFFHCQDYILQLLLCMIHLKLYNKQELQCL